MHSWTFLFLGSAQTCCPLLVRKLWKGGKDYRLGWVQPKGAPVGVLMVRLVLTLTHQVLPAGSQLPSHGGRMWHLHDSWPGALTAGFKVINHVGAPDASCDVGEATFSRTVKAYGWIKCHSVAKSVSQETCPFLGLDFRRKNISSWACTFCYFLVLFSSKLKN